MSNFEIKKITNFIFLSLEARCLPSGNMIVCKPRGCSRCGWPGVWICLLIFLTAFNLSAKGSAQTDTGEVTFRIEDAHTRVGWVRVNLIMSELKWVGDRMIGNYDIQVPLFSSKNEVGKFDLHAETDIGRLRTGGGKLEGLGIKDFDSGRTRQIKGEVIPDSHKPDSGVLLLSIDTGNRILHFRTRYHIEHG